MHANGNKKDALYFRSDGRCYYCGEPLKKDFVLEHMIPKSKGGKTTGNVIVSCPDCNTFKHTLSIEEFRKRIENALEETVQGRIIKKYYKIESKEIEFLYEKENLLEGLDDYLNGLKNRSDFN